jgi:hypothetical protein
LSDQLEQWESVFFYIRSFLQPLHPNVSILLFLADTMAAGEVNGIEKKMTWRLSENMETFKKI